MKAKRIACINETLVSPVAPTYTATLKAARERESP
jgi:hypothetical protein